MKSSEITFLPDSLLVCYQVMFTDYPDIVSVFQLQKMLKISRQLAYELINNGSIKAVKMAFDKIIKPEIRHLVKEASR